jgi:hypothetical protein
MPWALNSVSRRVTTGVDASTLSRRGGDCCTTRCCTAGAAASDGGAGGTGSVGARRSAWSSHPRRMPSSRAAAGPAAGAAAAAAAAADVNRCVPLALSSGVAPATESGNAYFSVSTARAPDEGDPSSPTTRARQLRRAGLRNARRRTEREGRQPGQVAGSCVARRQRCGLQPRQRARERRGQALQPLHRCAQHAGWRRLRRARTPRWCACSTRRRREGSCGAPVARLAPGAGEESGGARSDTLLRRPHLTVTMRRHTSLPAHSTTMQQHCVARAADHVVPLPPRRRTRRRRRRTREVRRVFDDDAHSRTSSLRRSSASKNRSTCSAGLRPPLLCMIVCTMEEASRRRAIFMKMSCIALRAKQKRNA